MHSDSKKTAARFVRNVGSNWGAFLFNAVVGFFLAPYVLGHLGATTYGIWALIGSLVGYLGLLDLGVRSAVIRFLSAFHSAGNHERSSDIKSAAVLAFSVAGCLAVALAAVVGLFVEQIFSIPPGSEHAARIAVTIMGANVAVALVTGVYGGVVVARHRFDLFNAVNVLATVVRSSAIVIALETDAEISSHTDQAIIVLAVIQLLASAVQLVLLWILSRKAYPEAKTSMRRAFSIGNLKEVLSFGLLSSAIHVLGSLTHNSGIVLVGALLPMLMVTYFSISESLAEYTRQFLSGITHTLMPAVSSLEGAGRFDGVTRVLMDGTRYAHLVILPIIATFMLRGDSFISLWMGAEYGKPSGQILMVMSVTLWAVIGHQICTTTMIGIGKQRGLLPIFGFEAAVSIVLSIVLIQEIGAIGAAFGVMIARLVVSFGLDVAYARRILRISVTEYYVDSIGRPVVAILPFAGASYAIERTWPAGNLGLFFLQVAVAIPIAILGSWIFGLKRDERTRLFGALRQKLA
jgi:O-antigen/teichoic acid export membrane protein